MQVIKVDDIGRGLAKLFPEDCCCCAFALGLSAREIGKPWFEVVV